MYAGDQETIDNNHDRERLALYLTGLLPDDIAEARAVLDLCKALLPLLDDSRTSQRERGGDEG